MNREEAATIIKAIGKHAIDTHLTAPGDIVDATVMAVQALVPKPDEVTGLVPCGCGGKAETHELFGEYRGTYMTDCKECATGTTQYNTEKESQDAWNTAMGWKGGAE